MAWYDNVANGEFTEEVKNEGKELFRASFSREMTKFKMLFKARGKWKIPEGLEEKFIYDDTLDNLLFDYEYLAGFKDDDGLPGVLPVVGVGDMNIYGRFDKYRVTGVARGYSREFTAENCAILSSVTPISQFLGVQYLGSPLRYLTTIADQIARAELTEALNIEQQRNPWVFTGEATEQPAVYSAINAIKNFATYIFKRKKSETNEFLLTPTHTEVTPIFNDLQTYRVERESDALTYLGYPSLPLDKAERMVVSEVKSRDIIAKAISNEMNRARSRWCDEMRKKFGFIFEYIPNDFERSEENDPGRDEESGRGDDEKGVDLQGKGEGGSNGDLESAVANS